MDPIDGLSEHVPDLTLSRDAADLFAYTRDLWPRELIRLRNAAPRDLPAAVVWPRSTAEIVALVQYARAEGIALLPFGAGSGVCGGIAPSAQHVVVDLKRLADFELDHDGPSLVCGPGALGLELERALERVGCSTGHFPSSILCSTVGGWVAARGAGQCSGRYGKIEDMVLGLECVLGTGDVVTLGRRPAPNLLPLFIGSEGTLGIISSVKLRLHPLPATRAFAAYSFPSIEAGFSAMREMFQSGLRPAVSRLYDAIDSLMLRQGSVKPRPMPRNPFAGLPPGNPQLRRSSELSARVTGAALARPRASNAFIAALERTPLGRATLILVWEGSAAETREDGALGERVALRHGARPLGEPLALSWYRHRYSVSYRQSPIFRLGAFSDTMEVAASWANLKTVYDAVRAALRPHAVVMAHLSHAYPDGCSIYFTFAAKDTDDDKSLERYDRAWRSALASAVAAGATISHHHGVGRSKRAFLEQELGGGAEALRVVSQVCDPARIMNPGNLLPPRRAGGETVGPPRSLPARAAIAIDEVSLLVDAAAGCRLRDVERRLGERGLTLDLADPALFELSVGEWLERGLPGSRDALDDPVDHVVAALAARTHSGERVALCAVPRRATGGDPQALFVGGSGRVGDIERAVLRVRSKGGRRARALPFGGERTQPLSDSERRLWEELVNAFAPGGSERQPDA